MAVVVIGSGATDKGAADWNRTVMEPVSLGETPVWGLNPGASTMRGYAIQPGDFVLFHSHKEFHMVAIVREVMRDAGVISRNLWPDQERLGSIHAWSTIFTFSVMLQDLSVSKDDVNSALGYSTVGGKESYGWSGPHHLRDAQSRTIAPMFGDVF